MNPALNNPSVSVGGATANTGFDHSPEKTSDDRTWKTPSGRNRNIRSSPPVTDQQQSIHRSGSTDNLQEDKTARSRQAAHLLNEKEPQISDELIASTTGSASDESLTVALADTTLEDNTSQESDISDSSGADELEFESDEWIDQDVFEDESTAIHTTPIRLFPPAALGEPDMDPRIHEIFLLNDIDLDSFPDFYPALNRDCHAFKQRGIDQLVGYDLVIFLNDQLNIRYNAYTTMFSTPKEVYPDIKKDDFEINPLMYILSHYAEYPSEQHYIIEQYRERATLLELSNKLVLTRGGEYPFEEDRRRSYLLRKTCHFDLRTVNKAATIHKTKKNGETESICTRFGIGLYATAEYPTAKGYSDKWPDGVLCELHINDHVMYIDLKLGSGLYKFFFNYMDKANPEFRALADDRRTYEWIKFTHLLKSGRLFIPNSIMIPDPVNPITIDKLPKKRFYLFENALIRDCHSIRCCKIIGTESGEKLTMKIGKTDLDSNQYLKAKTVNPIDGLKKVTESYRLYSSFGEDQPLSSDIKVYYIDVALPEYLSKPLMRGPGNTKERKYYVHFTALAKNVTDIQSYIADDHAHKEELLIRVKPGLKEQTEDFRKFYIQYYDSRGKWRPEPESLLKNLPEDYALMQPMT